MFCNSFVEIVLKMQHFKNYFSIKNELKKSNTK